MALTVIPLSGLANDVVDSISAGAGGGGPRIANVQIANSSWGLLDDTAVSTDGGYVLINGSGFVSGCSVLVANSQATPVTFANSSLLRVEVPAKSASTYAVYVLNPDGGTAIGINALTYSAFPAWSTGSTLSGSVDAEISVQLSASDATTYTLQAGSSLPANTTLASNGLFSGTITGINEDTTYTFTVEATDAENQNTPRTFSITITVGDNNFKSTTLLLNADANTFVRDASNNAFNIIVNGDTKPSAFSPFNTNWSNFFDGTGDYLSVANNAAFLLATNNFTIEFWVYPTNVSSTQSILSKGDGGYSPFLIQNSSGSGLIYISSAGSAWDVASGVSLGTIPIFTWTHIAITRDGNTFKTFKNGIQVSTFSSSASLYNPANPVTIGYNGGGYPEAFYGNISNLRIINGTALYTANFTPPTAPLTAVTNTTLLTCQSNRFIDNSTNAFTITKAGDVKVTSFGPFTETDTTTGSGYFDGTGDFLDPTTSNSAFSFDTGDFTVEAWIYPNSLSNYMGIVGQAITSADTQHSFFVFANGQVTHQSYFAVGLATTTSNITTGMWHHVAAVRSGANGAIFINGVRAASNTAYTKNYSNTNPIRIGAAAEAGSAVFNGYISNARVVKGTAVYDPTQSTITVPTTSLTAIANTNLLTLQNRIGVTNHTFVDESGNRNIVTRSGNASQGSFSPFSPTGWSGYFDGSGDYFSVADNAALTMGASSFTIEGWFYPLNYTGTDKVILLHRPVTTARGIVLSFSQTTGTPFVLAGDTDSSAWNVSLTSSTAATLNAWNHVAFTRNSSTWNIWLNGTSVASNTASFTVDDTSTLYLFANLDGTSGFPGYISNFRIIKGNALYTSNFTPSTTPLTPVANTQLLILRSNTVEDDSPNNFAITKYNDVKISPFSPFKSHTITANTHSVYFDGTGDYLSTTATAVGTNSFTVEAWVYLNTGSAYMGVYSSTEDTSGVGINLGITNDNNVQGFVGRGNSATFLNGTSPLSLKTWYHLAFVRNGSALNLYVNGTSVASNTSSASITATSAVVGRFYISYNGYYMNGFISNVRLINGTAQYTSNFTPPTAQLTAVSNTQLLTCQTSTMVDNSTSLRAIIPLGNVHVRKFNPFGESVTSSIQEYNPITHQGSVYLDGSDYLAISSSNLALGTSDFEISFYMYLFSTGGYIIGTSNVSGSWAFNLSSTALDFRVDSLAAAAVASTSIPGGNLLGQWVKIRVERISNVVYLFVNEKFQASASVSTNFTQTSLGIGSFGQTATYASTAYISDVKIRKGSRTSSSTHGLILDMPFNRGGIVDVTGRNILECVGDARVRTDTKKYGSGAMYFDGTGDYLTLTGNPTDFAFGTGDFTIEMWLYTNSVTNSVFYDGRPAGTNGAYPMLYFVSGVLLYWVNSADRITSGTAVLSTSTWYHIALCRSGTNTKLFLNGVQIGSTYTDSNNYLNTGNRPWIGVNAATTNTSYLNGYIDDLRITKGVARYTTNFTAPTSAHITK